MKKCYARMYQKVFYLVSFFLPWRKPKLLEGVNRVLNVPDILLRKSVQRVFIITDQGIMKLKLMQGLLDALYEANIEVIIYDETVANPTVSNVEEALELFKSSNAEAIIAFGGGSPMDCAKAMAARYVRPNKTLNQMKGVLKVRKRIPLLIAIPTTAGTGSEATLAAVVSNPSTHEKYAINDHVLIPQYAILDPMLTLGLPPHLTGATGMDALTHAVEAYIGKSNTKETKRMSIEAIKLIHQHLLNSYNHPEDIMARQSMLKASYYAGIAFTRAYVGYVHAIAHTLGGFYNVPHGLANAMILPHVLEAYGKHAFAPLSKLTDALKLTERYATKKEKANAFIAWVVKMNEELGIPKNTEVIKYEDIDAMVNHAYKEAYPLYPTPAIWSKEQLKTIILTIRFEKEVNHE